MPFFIRKDILYPMLYIANFIFDSIQHAFNKKDVISSGNLFDNLFALSLNKMLLLFAYTGQTFCVSSKLDIHKQLALEREVC